MMIDFSKCGIYAVLKTVLTSVTKGIQTILMFK